MELIKSLSRQAFDWLSDGHRVAAATLIDTDGSAPLDPGATMLVTNSGRIEGSVTGGCVEGALFEEAQEVLGGAVPRLRTYGISDSSAADVGLMCGGTVHIFVHEIRPSFREPLGAVADSISGGSEAAIATLLDGPRAGHQIAVAGGRRHGSFELGEPFDRAVERDALGCLAHGTSTLRRYGSGGEIMGDEIGVFIQAFSTAPVLLIFGAIDFAAAIARVAKTVGYKVTICDARRPFAEAERFQVADEVVVDWPDRYLAGRQFGPRDVILVFTHDPKFDEPALLSALATDAGYIGALGSRQTQADRVERLSGAGISDGQLARISAPCGLDIGARTPEETAVSILAEVIASASGQAGGPLSEKDGKIHPPRRPSIELAR
jgi:xanthine dehydrogenase accessory factor